MKMKKVIIGSPYIKHRGNKVRLCTTISSQNKATEVWYELDSKYASYLFSDRVDPFFVALIPYCLHNNINIEVSEESGISTELLYRMREHLLPSLKYAEGFSQIEIVSNCVGGKIKEGRGVAAGVSRGVDSLYTLIRNRSGLCTPTFATLFNVQAYSSNGGETGEKIFQEDLVSAKRFLNEFNETYNTKMELIWINSNIQTHYPVELKYGATFRDAAAIIVLKALIRIYLFSENWVIDEFTMRKDARHYEAWTLFWLSWGGQSILPAGMDVTRIEKLNVISQHPITYRYLNVCRKAAYDATHGISKKRKMLNCTYECTKCRRTTAELLSIDKLDLYDNVFDIEWVNTHKAELIEEVVARKEEDLWNDIYKRMRKKGWIS